MLLIALKSVLVFALGLGLLALFRRRSAALRRAVLAATVLAALLFPAISLVAPRFPAVDLSPATAGVPELPIVPSEPLQWVSPPRDTAPHAARAATEEAPSGTRIALSLPVLIWALGAALLAGRAAVGWLQTRGMIRRATADPAWEQACAAACTELGLARPLLVRLGESAGVPLVAGILRPVILIPTSLRDWPEDRQRLVLLHELAHVAAHDCFFFAASRLACALYWPNPLVWLVHRKLRALGEAAADDAVLRAGVRASTYAQELLDAARGVRTAPAGAIAMARETGLEPRLRAVLDADRSRKPLTRRGIVLVGSLALGATALAACARNQRPSALLPSAQAAAPRQAQSAQPAATPAASNTSKKRIDPRVQAIVDAEVARTLAATRAASVSVVVLDAPSGRVLGAHDADRMLAPGATIKPLVVAAGLASGLSSDARFDDEGGRWKHDGTVLADCCDKPLRQLDVTDILVRSSNIGVVKIAERIGQEALHGFLTRVGLGRGLPATPTELRREAAVAYGMGLTATPLQVATAYTALADDGVLALPSGHHEHVMPADAARAVRGMLEHAVSDPHATGRRARIQGVRVAGKTGTAGLINPAGGFFKKKYYPSFVGMVPADKPAYVVLVGVVDPKGAWAGSQVAAPAFARIARRALALR